MIKNWILNLILSEKEKVIIVESLEDRAYMCSSSIGESCKDLFEDIKLLKCRFNTKTKGNTYYELDEKLETAVRHTGRKLKRQKRLKKPLRVNNYKNQAKQPGFFVTFLLKLRIK